MINNIAVEISAFRLWRSLFWREIWHFRLRRWIPRLVWIDQEVSVRITFSEAKLPPIAFGDMNEMAHEALAHLDTGALAEIERRLSEIGIKFDKGAGLEGRDWEWDWSLHGPVTVKFVSARKRRPEQ